MQVVFSEKRLRNIWQGMRQRCTNPKATGYVDYGGRDICVCSDWDTYPAFKEWALVSGYQDHLSIERSDVNGNYTPTNCVWADNSTQCANKRKRQNVLYKYVGVRKIHGDKWRAVIDWRKKQVHIGVYISELQAAQARDAYIKANNLPHKLNF